MTERVYVHIGLPKTGTTYLQRALWLSQDTLAEQGVLVPGESHRVQRYAFWDLLGRRLRGADQPHIPGAWQSLVDSVRAWDGPRVVLSEEFLVHVRPRHVRRMARAFAPAEMHVVVTVRDLERVICSTWQEEVAKSQTWPYDEFVAAVTDPERGPATAAVRFWLRQDLQRVLGMWESVVPPERVHVALVPPAGGPPTTLLERFARAADLDPAALQAPPKEANTGIGMAETELIRRLNAGLRGRLDERQYLHVVRRVVRSKLRELPQTTYITLPRQQRAWVGEHARQMVDLLKSRPYDIVGDLDDLLPGSAAADDAEGRETTAEDIAEAAVATLTAVLEDYARLWNKVRRREKASKAGGVTRLTSASRALGFSAKLRLLELADRNRFAARAARGYLRRTSRPRQ